MNKLKEHIIGLPLLLVVLYAGWYSIDYWFAEEVVINGTTLSAHKPIPHMLELTYWLIGVNIFLYFAIRKAYPYFMFLFLGLVSAGILQLEATLPGSHLNFFDFSDPKLNLLGLGLLVMHVLVFLPRMLAAFKKK